MTPVEIFFVDVFERHQGPDVVGWGRDDLQIVERGPRDFGQRPD